MRYEAILYTFKSLQCTPHDYSGLPKTFAYFPPENCRVAGEGHACMRKKQSVGYRKRRINTRVLRSKPSPPLPSPRNESHCAVAYVYPPCDSGWAAETHHNDYPYKFTPCRPTRQAKIGRQHARVADLAQPTGNQSIVNRDRPVHHPSPPFRRPRLRIYVLSRSRHAYYESQLPLPYLFARNYLPAVAISCDADTTNTKKQLLAGLLDIELYRAVLIFTKTPQQQRSLVKFASRQPISKKWATAYLEREGVRKELPPRGEAQTTNYRHTKCVDAVAGGQRPPGKHAQVVRIHRTSFIAVRGVRPPKPTLSTSQRCSEGVPRHGTSAAHHCSLACNPRLPPPSLLRTFLRLLVLLRKTSKTAPTPSGTRHTSQKRDSIGARPKLGIGIAWCTPPSYCFRRRRRRRPSDTAP